MQYFLSSFNNLEYGASSYAYNHGIPHEQWPLLQSSYKSSNMNFMSNEAHVGTKRQPFLNHGTMGYGSGIDNLDSMEYGSGIGMYNFKGVNQSHLPSADDASMSNPDDSQIDIILGAYDGTSSHFQPNQAAQPPTSLTASTIQPIAIGPVNPAIPRMPCMWQGCIETFSRSTDIPRHIQVVHLQQKFHCQVLNSDGTLCVNNHGMGYSRHDKLREHQKRKHGV